MPKVGLQSIAPEDWEEILEERVTRHKRWISEEVDSFISEVMNEYRQANRSKAEYQKRSDQMYVANEIFLSYFSR